MTVGDVIKVIKTRLMNVTAGQDDAVILMYLNLGMGELYNRFNLSIKMETLITSSDLALYELRSNDVVMLLSLYNEAGRELKQTDVSNNLHFDYKIVNYRSFVLTYPKDEIIYALYKGSPIELKDENDILEIPLPMIETLLMYITGNILGTIYRDNGNEFSMYQQMIETSMVKLENQGYRIPLNIERFSVQSKGFV